ncbi:hypothetical protein AB7M35_002169 [Amorphus suaedae]
MPSAAEIQRAFQGAWALLLNRKDGMLAFDLSIDGFYRSFGAVFLVAPLYAIAALAEVRLLQFDGAPVDGFPLVWFFFWKFAGLGVDWLALPIVLALLARPLGLAARYVPFIVARNWTSPVAMSMSILPSVLYAAGLVGQELAAILFLVVVVGVIRYQYQVVRIALQTTIAMSIAVVAFDLTLSLVLAELMSRLAGF